MKSLNIYSEYTKNSSVGSIKDNLSTKEINYKDEILSYLKSGRHVAAACGSAKDIFTGERLKDEWILLSDGEYEWTSDLIYYVEKYNLMLPDDFIIHVLSKIEK